MFKENKSEIVLLTAMAVRKDVMKSVPMNLALAVPEKKH